MLFLTMYTVKKILTYIFISYNVYSALKIYFIGKMFPWIAPQLEFVARFNIPSILELIFYHAGILSFTQSKPLCNKFISCSHFSLAYVINSSAISLVKKNVVPVGWLWKSVFISVINWWIVKIPNSFRGSASNAAGIVIVSNSVYSWITYWFISA